MKLTLKDPTKVNTFANIFRHSKNILDDANIVFSDTHIYMQGMDAAHALLFELKIMASWFDKYEMNAETPQTFGLHCETFFKIINCLNENQYIELVWETDNDKMHIAFKGDDSISKEFELSGIDMDTEMMVIPDVEYTADICIKSDEFAEIIKELSIFNDTVQVKCTEEKIELLASGTLGSMTASIKEDDIISYAIEEDTELVVNYGLSFMDKVCHFNKLSTDLYIHSSLSYPMKMIYSLDEPNEDGEEQITDDPKSYCRFFIAPKEVD